MELLEDRRLLAFGAEGIVTTNIVGASAGVPGGWIEGLAVQTDGRIIAAGNVGLARYQTDGSLDASFNAGGAQPGTNFVSGRYLNDVAVQPDGKIVAGGRTYATGNDSFLLQRFTTDGLLDSAFGTGGVATTNFRKTATDEISAIALQSDGKIVAVGRINVSFGVGAWGVARYTPNGLLDTTFDGDGWLTTTFTSKPGNSGDFPNAVAVQPDGKIVVAGTAYGGSTTGKDFAVVRYHPNGSLDQTFGQGGKRLTDFGSEMGQARGSDEAGAVTLQQDGRIVVGGSATGGITFTPSGFALARYTVNGALDATFGGDGKARLNGPYIDGGRHRYEGLAVQADGKIVGVGGVDSVYVTRFNTDGSLDSSFNGTGLKHFEYEPATYYTYGNDLAVQPDGKIVAGGGSGGEGPPMKFALARMNADGSFDAAEPLIVASRPTTTGATESLTVEQLQFLLAEAAARWAAAGEDVSNLNNVAVQIADLSDGFLGMASGNTIWIDNNADGWGWFVDATPGDDSEFTMPGNQGEVDRIDLLTVLMHELGHLSAHDHDVAGVMAETLAAGVRRTDVEHGHAALSDQIFGRQSDHLTDTWLRGWLREYFDSTHPRAKRHR